MDDVRQTYTVDEVAAILGVSRSTAYAAVRDGTIPSIKLGRKIVVPRAAVRKLLSLKESSNAIEKAVNQQEA